MSYQWPSIFLSDARVKGEGKVIGCEPQAPYRDDCPNCGGLSNMIAFYVDSGPYQNPPGAPRGKAIKWINGSWFIGGLHSEPCPVCAGFQKHTWLLRMSRLEGLDQEIRLEQFMSMKGKEAAKDIAASLLSQTPYPAGFCTFYGEFGVGKSMLLKALVNGFRVAEVTAAYSTMADLLAEVRDEFGSDARNAAETLIQEFRSVRVLAIDEIDRVNMTPWASETMFRLLNGRYSAQDRMLTVLASNSAPAQLPEQLQYLASRMTDGIIIEIGGMDVRPGIGIKREIELKEFAP